MKTLLVLSLTFVAAASAADSPLVALARRSTRHAPKAKIVITHDNLARYNGGFTTTESQPPITPPGAPPAPTPEMIHAENWAKERAAYHAARQEKERARAEAEQKLARTAAREEAGFDGNGRDDAEEIVSGPEGTPPP